MQLSIFDPVFICNECIAFISLNEEKVQQQETICSSKLFSAITCFKKFSSEFLRSPFPCLGASISVSVMLTVLLSSQTCFFFFFCLCLFLLYIHPFASKKILGKKGHMCLCLISTVCHLFSWGAILLHEGAYYFLLCVIVRLGIRPSSFNDSLPKSQGQQQWKLTDVYKWLVSKRKPAV